MDDTIYITIQCAPCIAHAAHGMHDEDADGNTVRTEMMKKAKFENLTRSKLDMAILFDDFTKKVNHLLKTVELKENES